MIEELLKPALEAYDTHWGLAIKRASDRTVPRIFFQIARPSLKSVLSPFCEFGYLPETAAVACLEWENKLEAGEHIFVSLDPTLERLASLDFCSVPSAQFPGFQDAAVLEHFDYLKLRISASLLRTEFIAYMPLKKILDLRLKELVP
jgi:hypothetical protein